MLYLTIILLLLIRNRCFCYKGGNRNLIVVSSSFITLKHFDRRQIIPRLVFSLDFLKINIINFIVTIIINLLHELFLRNILKQFFVLPLALSLHSVNILERRRENCKLYRWYLKLIKATFRWNEKHTFSSHRIANLFIRKSANQFMLHVSEAENIA